MTSTTTMKMIEVLRRIFAAYGLPQQIVSDNGPQFVSPEFSSFLKANEVRHTRCTLPTIQRLMERQSSLYAHSKSL